MSESTFGFKKRAVKGQFARKRKESSSEEEKKSSDEEPSSSAVVRPDAKERFNPNMHSTKAVKRQRKDKDSDDSDSDASAENKIVVSYKSKRSAMPEGPRDMGATAEMEIETETDRDAIALFKKRQEVNKELEGKEDDKKYRGLNNYTEFFKKRDTAQGNAGSGSNSVGPMRAPTNIRSTVRWDYQPDICKDYKETGFCGFGDSCKFLHDRGDYKHGWQLEMDEIAKQKAKSYEIDSDDDDKKYEIHSDEEDLPFKCLICRKSFVDPVVTRCQHYFCEKCALERYKKTQRCFACSAQTSGVFNPAKKLMERLAMKGEEEGSDYEGEAAGGSEVQIEGAADDESDDGDD